MRRVPAARAVAEASRVAAIAALTASRG